MRRRYIYLIFVRVFLHKNIHLFPSKSPKINNNFVFSGTTSKRRNKEVERLNELYLDILPLQRSVQKCLKYMCQTEPYRMLRDWSYEMLAEPLRNDPGPSSDFVEVRMEQISSRVFYIYTYFVLLGRAECRERFN